MQVYSWDDGNYLGEIEEAEVTYNVVGNANEYGVAIGETSIGNTVAIISDISNANEICF